MRRLFKFRYARLAGKLQLNEAEKAQARRRLVLKRRLKPLLTRYGRMSSVLGPKVMTS